jgi:type I restriction enzyme R subunit
MTYLEDDVSQIPALELLINLGFTYLSPAEAMELRGGRNSNVLLHRVLQQQLPTINKGAVKGRNFSDGTFQQAVNTLQDIQFDGLVRTNEKIYDLLTLGRSFEETIDGNKKSYSLKFIDWLNPGKNVFHVTEEYEVARQGSYDTRRPDIVLFVNGIPFVIIECKRPDLRHADPIDQAIEQHNRNQKNGEIPELFIFSQYLLALATNNAMYATTGTEHRKFWSKWRNLENCDSAIEALINQPLDTVTAQKLLTQPFRNPHTSLSAAKEHRLVTEQDRVLQALCAPESLLENSFRNVVYDGTIKKVARYQQHHTVRNILERVRRVGKDGKRKGGVVFHTQGSGKSLTMVLLAKALVLEKAIPNPKIVLVTDRKDLDRQIRDNFKNCGLQPQQATTGSSLIELIDDGKAGIITTVINKFKSGLNRRSYKNESPNIFLLIDEGHRTQYGSLNVAMQRIFPNACYIGFTGTPLMKKEKNTAHKFGGIIEPAYTIRQAVEDHAVVPLLYEGRTSVMKINTASIDAWFDRITKDLNADQQRDLKSKFAQSDKINTADQPIKVVAYDISDHYARRFKGTEFKAQLAAPDKKSALRYKHYLDECGVVSSAVIISGPDTREGHSDIYSEPNDEVQKFWAHMMERWGNEDAYNEGIINQFNHAADPEILIVVDKLLTGFDAPRNTVLYITKNLRDHTLLQAIARVNRLYPGKDYGFIIDYYGVVGSLDKALSEYEALAEFDAEDVADAFQKLDEEVEKLAQRHSNLWDVFKTVKNKQDTESLEQFLADEALRQIFYERLSLFSRTLELALANLSFVESTPEAKVATYKKDLKFFMNLRASVQRRYAEKIDFKEYEGRIQKLMDTYVNADEVETITELVNIFDQEKFEAEVAKVVGEAAKADTIASRTKRTCTEKMQEDPAFYQKFSKMLEKIIEDWKQRRITEAEYLRRAQAVRDQVVTRTDDDTPDSLKGYEQAKAFYGIVAEHTPPYGKPTPDAKEKYAEVSLRINEIIEEKSRIVDWQRKADVHNAIRNEIEDCLLEFKDRHGIALTYEDIDNIMDGALEIAKYRSRS